MQIGTMRIGTMRIGPTLPLMLFIALTVSCPRPQVRTLPGCAKDVDCKGARICDPRGVCVDPPAEPATATQGDEPGPVPGQSANAAPKLGPPPFAMFGGNAQNTGALAGPAPDSRPTEVWRVTAGGPMVGSPTVGPDGTVFATSHDGKLYAVAPDGAVRWRFAAGDRIWSTPAVAEDGTVYTGSDDDHLYAIDGATGSEKWRLRIGTCDPPIGFGPEGTRCDVDGGPTLGPDGTIYVGGDGVYAVWPDGTLRWKFATPEHVITTPALAPASAPNPGTVYAGCMDDALYAIAPDGTKAWEMRTRRDIESSPAVAPDGTIYIGGDDDKLYAIAPDGQVRWKVVTGGDVRSSPAIAADGTVYVGSHDGNLYAISADGAVKWRFAAADKIQGSPGIAADGTVLFGAQDDHLYALTPEGVLRWYLAFDSDIDSTPALARDGTLYATSDDKTLRAFR